MKPLIGLTPLWDDECANSWMLPAYSNIIEKAGAATVTLTATTDAQALKRYIELCDGIVFTGGQDVDPAIYGKEVSPCCGSLCPTRDTMEVPLLRLAIECDKPVFGICRGLQFINAALGGTLYQDLATEHPSATIHRMDKPYHRGIHTVTVLPESPLARIVGAGLLPVNSLHHQAIEKLAPGFVVDAISEDGLIEAAHDPRKRFLAGVQWHPELSFEADTRSLAILKRFVEACCL